VRRWHKIAGLGLGVVTIVTVIEARYYRHGLSLVHPVRKPVTAAEHARTHTFAEDVSFETSDGVTLRGDYVPSKNGIVVVMCHGLFENRMHFLFETEMLTRHGYGALFFDWRAHGDSDGALSTWGYLEQLDLESAITFAMSREDAKIVTLGFSIGATTVYLEATHDARVRAIIIEAIWPTIEEEMRDKMTTLGFISYEPTVMAMQRAGLDFSKVRPIDHAAQLGARPKLFITGSADTDTPVAIMRRVVDATPEPKQLWVVPGAQHGTYTADAPAEYERVVIDFLEHAFAR
jgi:pimeloyl-ACP methyl ester carboxylesterase